MGNSVNLLNFVPLKFTDSQVLIDYLSALGDDLTGIASASKLYNVGNWLDLIDNLENFFDPAKVNVLYLRNLAALIGLDLAPEDITTVSVLRASVVEAIDWYKVKGTYQSLQIIAVINQDTFNIWDMYTNDYITFGLNEWFVGNEDENPTDYPFASGYYKSPHFGLEVVLNKVYTADASIGAPNDHLWHNSYLANIQDGVEKTRPAHIVPHYMLLLNPQSDVNGSITTVDGDIQTQALLDAGFGGFFFDGQDATPADSWTFDEDVDSEGTTDVTFDAAYGGSLDNIDSWRLGTGSKGLNLDDSGYTPVLEDTSPVTGTLTTSNITEYDNRIEIEFTVPKATVLSGVSELGIYAYTGTATEELAIMSLFPDIFKNTESELRVLVILTKE